MVVELPSRPHATGLLPLAFATRNRLIFRVRAPGVGHAASDHFRIGVTERPMHLKPREAR